MTDMHYHTSLSIGDEVLHSDLHTCAANALLIEPYIALVPDFDFETRSCNAVQVCLIYFVPGHHVKLHT